MFDLDLCLPNVLNNKFSDKRIFNNKMKNIFNKFGNFSFEELSYLKYNIEMKLTGEIENCGMIFG